MSTLGSKGQPQYSGGDTVTIAQYLSQIGNYAALVGNKIAGSSSQRTNFSTSYGFAPFPGLEYVELDTGNRYEYFDILDGPSGWIGTRPESGAVNFATTDFTAAGGGYQASRVVNLTPGRFTAPPIVTFGVFTGAAQDQHVGSVNVTASTFTLYYWRSNLTQTTVGWTASPQEL